MTDRKVTDERVKCRKSNGGIVVCKGIVTDKVSGRQRSNRHKERGQAQRVTDRGSDKD